MNADLLDRLQEADHDTWEKIARGIPLKPCGQYFAYDQGNPSVHQFKDAYIPFGELMPEVALAWLQACIQAAIRAREWTLQTVQRLCTAGTYIYWAKISTDMNGEKSLSSAYGDTEAEALLRAYLAAIQEAE